MTSFTDVFSGSNIYSSDVSFLPLTLSADLTLEWPLSRSEGGTTAARIIEITTSGGSHTITLPDADKAGKGETILFNNLGPADVDVVDADGGAVATLPSGEIWQVYLSDNADAAGTWRVFQYGVGSSSVQAASLVGYGIKAVGSTLAQSNEVHTFNTTYTIGAPDRAALYVWTGGVDTLSLPTAASVGNDFFVSVRNSGSGNLTVDPSGAETINDASTLVLLPGDSAMLVTDGAEWFTIGLGQSADFAFDYTSINLAGLSGTYTLSGSELNRVSYKFTGALAGNIEVVVPATVQQYWVDNATSGAYTLKVKTAAQASPPTVTQGSRGIYYCNGTDVVKADTSSVASPLGIADGGSGATTASGARAAFGATSVGDAVFTAADETAARTAILAAPVASPTFTGTPAAPTAAPGTNTTQLANTAFVAAAIAALINSAPGVLDTLDEIAAALGDDANFAATMTTALGTKLAASSYTAADVLSKLLTVDGSGSGLDADLLDGQSSAYYAPVASPALTGNPTAPTPTAGDNDTSIATTAFVRTPAIQSVASSATVTPTFANDMVIITAQAAGLTLANPTGTAQDGAGIVIRIKDNGTARSITYGSQYRAIGVSLPSTTVINKTLYLGMVFNSADTKWDVVSVAQEA